MNYPIKANVINILFILALLFGPSGYCLYKINIPSDIGRNVIILSAFLSVFVLFDWYHAYFSNTYIGLFKAFISGLSFAFIILVISSQFVEHTIYELAFLKSSDAWSSITTLFRFYMASVGIAAAAIFSLPRLFLIKKITNDNLPT